MKITSTTIKSVCSLCLLVAPLSAQTIASSSSPDRSGSSSSVVQPVASDESDGSLVREGGSTSEVGESSGDEGRSEPSQDDGGSEVTAADSSTVQSRTKTALSESKPLSQRVLSQPTIAEQMAADSPRPEVTIIDYGASMANAELYGEGLSGSLGMPTLTYMGNVAPGHTIDLVIQNSSGSSTAGYLLIGYQASSRKMHSGGTVLVDASLSVQRVKLAPGTNIISFAIPHDASRNGSAIYAQVLIKDSGADGGLAMSRGLKLFL